MDTLYQDRTQAGLVLAEKLTRYANREDVIVLALPRGGVPVAYEIAKTLEVPLDVFIVRKLGVPFHPELAMGAISMDGAVILNQNVINELAITPDDIQHVIIKEKKELKRREEVYRDDKPFPDVKNKTVILVDDGIATGATIRAAIQSLQQHQPARLIVAVPVAAKDTADEIERLVNQLICPLRPIHFNAVGAWYQTFDQTSDEEVRICLDSANN
jgi:putative phosphoribosyl transferase